jgi:antitoxin (DNA-binding transcriptional repressor) of toxin-antitoxin stability system
MESISLPEFEANCLFYLEQVDKSGEPLTLLKNGIPFTRILPCRSKRKSLFGMHRKKIQIHGDIVSPIDDEWDALK